MTTKLTLRAVAEIQARAFDDMRTALNMHDYELAALCGTVVTACAAHAGRIGAAPARAIDRATYYRDTLDVDTFEPPQSEAEYIRDETERDRERPWRRHDRD